MNLPTLYHGTSERVWRAIQAAGAVQPRNMTGASNWCHTIKSRPDAVYLTDTYAPYFAIGSLDADIDLDKPGARIAIIEFDTAAIVANLVPDEDALEQSSRTGKVGKLKMRQRTERYRARLHTYIGTERWRESLAYLGTCAHIGPIPLTAVKRVALIDIRQAGLWSIDAMNPSITHANYRFCGERYREHLQQGFTLDACTIEQAGA